MAPGPDTPPSQDGETSSATGEGGGEEFPVGSMVWGKLPGYDWWPGVVISYSQDRVGSGGDGERGGGVQVWIKWFGENNLSQVGQPLTGPIQWSIIVAEQHTLCPISAADREGGTIQ